MLEKKIKDICVVNHDYWQGAEMWHFVRKLFPEKKVWLCCMDYTFESETSGYKPFPDLIITTGTCKHVNPYDYKTHPEIIKYKWPKQFGKENKIPVINALFLGRYIPQVLAFRLEKYRDKI